MPFADGRVGIRSGLLGLLAVLGGAEALLVHLWNPGPTVLLLQEAYAVVTGGIILFLARRPLRPPQWASAAMILGTFVLTILIAQFALHAYPSSGDEYGYDFLAETLAHGRLWNLAYPPGLRDVLATYYIGGHGDQRLSQYFPGWPVVLLPFELAGMPQLANAVVGLIAAWFLFRALRYVAAPPAVRLAALMLGVAAPFTLFNDASFFNHPLTAAALLAIIWLDLRDVARPAALNRVGMGVAFSVLLTTRIETLLLAFILFAADGIVRHRLRFIRWARPLAFGAAPLTVLFLAYNWKITGSPFTTTFEWVSPGIGFGPYAAGADGPHSPLRGFLHTVIWFADWQDFVSPLLLPLYLVALWQRVASRTVRWFDLLWPAIVGLFVFYPDNGGYQYGPRYWYLAHAAMPVTVAAGLKLAGDFWQVGRFRFAPVRLAATQLASFAGFTLGFAYFLHLQVENRMLPSRVAALARSPALVLMADQARRYVPWQAQPYWLLGKDFTRNGTGALPPVAMGLDLGDARTALLCQQMPDRALYRLHFEPRALDGSLVPICNGASVP